MKNSTLLLTWWYALSPIGNILKTSFLRFGIILTFFPFFSTAQNLTISSTGTTVPQPEWAVSGTNPVTIAVTGTTSIHPSVLEGYLNAGVSVIVSNPLTGTAINSSIEKTAGASASLTFKDNQYIKTAENISIASTSNALDIIFWADAGGLQAGNIPAFIQINSGSSLLSNGGKIVLAGGTDDGSNGGASGDGIPDQFAWNGYDNIDNGAVLDGGVNIGPSGGLGTIVTIDSDGGDIIIRGSTSDDCQYPGISSQRQFKISSGTGTIEMHGISSVSHGIELCYGSSPDLVIESASTNTPAITMRGYTSVSDGIGLWIAHSSTGDVLIQSTSGIGGGIWIEGESEDYAGIILGNFVPSGMGVQILSQAGEIRFKGIGVPEFSLSLEGKVYLGNRRDATPVAGTVPGVSSSTADIRIDADFNYFGYFLDNFVRFGSTGDLTFYAHSPGYTDSIGCYGALQFDGINNIVIGEETENYPVHIDADLTAVNNISIFSSDLRLKRNFKMQSLGGGDITFHTDQLTINDGFTIGSSGKLIIEPKSGGTTIGLAAGAGTLGLAASYFSDNFDDGFNEIVIGNNAAGLITLGGALTIRDDLQLITNSDFQLNDKLTINENNCRFVGNSILGSAVAYVRTNGVGRLIQDIPNTASKLFPVGTDYYNPVTITNNTNINDEFFASASNGVYQGGGTSGTSVGFPRVNITWNLGNSGGSTGSGTVDLNFGWHPDNVELLMTTPSLLHHNGTRWERKSGPTSGDMVLSIMNYSGYGTAFSPFTIGEETYLLPDKKISLSGKRNNRIVELEWLSMGDPQAEYFEVQRKAPNGGFETIGRVNAGSDQYADSIYKFIDNNPLSAQELYRIKEVSFNGQITYSTAVNLSAFTYGEYKITSIAGTQKVLVEMPDSFRGKAEAIVYNQLGHVVHRSFVFPGRNIIHLPFGRGAEILFIKVTDGRNNLVSGQISLF